MKVYIGFSKPTSSFAPFASLIKWVESRPYDHCYIRFQEPTGQWMIFQASKEMVNMYCLPVWLEFNSSLKEYELDITSDQNMDLWTFVKNNLGIPYSLIEDFGLLLMKIFPFIKDNPFNKGMSAQFCSKLAAIICQMFGIKLPDEVSDIDPSLLDQILSNAGLPCNTSVQLA